MSEIIEINLAEICDNPQQAEVYGITYIENEFIASVAEQGIITPIIVCKAEIYGIEGCKFVMISGHRRAAAAQENRIETIPAIIRDYKSRDEAEIEFLFSNMQREKTKKQKIKEFIFTKNALKKILQVSDKTGTWQNTEFGNNRLTRVLGEALKKCENEDSKIDSYALLKEQTGFSEYEQTYLNVLFSDEWLQNNLEKLRKIGLKLEKEEQLIAIRDFEAKKYENEESTLNASVSEVKKVFLAAATSLQKPKKVKKEKPKKEEKIENKDEVYTLSADPQILFIKSGDALKLDICGKILTVEELLNLAGVA